MFLKVSQTKGITRFHMAGKLSLRYNGPYLVIQRVAKVAYCLELLPDLLRVHNVFMCLNYESTSQIPFMQSSPTPYSFKKTCHMRTTLCKFWIRGRNNSVENGAFSKGPLGKSRDIGSNLGTKAGDADQIPLVVLITRCV